MENEFRRVLEELLRVDYRGLLTNGQAVDGWWMTEVPGNRIRIPIQSDGQQGYRIVEAWILTDADLIDTVEALVEEFAPTGDPVAEAEWAELMAKIQPKFS